MYVSLVAYMSLNVCSTMKCYKYYESPLFTGFDYSWNSLLWNSGISHFLNSVFSTFILPEFQEIMEIKKVCMSVCTFLCVQRYVCRHLCMIIWIFNNRILLYDEIQLFSEFPDFLKFHKYGCQT